MMTELGRPDLGEIICAAIEEAGIAGLCREGQIEFAMQEARKLRPGLIDEELLELVKVEVGQ